MFVVSPMNLAWGQFLVEMFHFSAKVDATFYELIIKCSLAGTWLAMKKKNLSPILFDSTELFIISYSNAKRHFPSIISTPKDILVFKNNLSLFCHINQNFNELLYKSLNKFPSDTKITIKLHKRTHTRTTWTHSNAGTQTHRQARMLSYTHAHTQKQKTTTEKHRKKCAILDLALWTYGAVCIDLLVWVAMQCNNCRVCRMESLCPQMGHTH